MVWVQVCQECTNNLTNKQNYIMAENRTLKGIYGEAGVHLVVTGNTAVGEFCAITSSSSHDVKIKEIAISLNISMFLICKSIFF